MKSPSSQDEFPPLPDTNPRGASTGTSLINDVFGKAKWPENHKNQCTKQEEVHKYPPGADAASAGPWCAGRVSAARPAQLYPLTDAAGTIKINILTISYSLLIISHSPGKITGK